MRRPCPTGSCCAKRKKLFIKHYFYIYTLTPPDGLFSCTPQKDAILMGMVSRRVVVPKRREKATNRGRVKSLKIANLNTQRLFVLETWKRFLDIFP
jgi:hypothetical protein